MGLVDIIGSGLVRSVLLACLLCLFFLAVFLILLDLLVIFLILPVFVRTEEYVKRLHFLLKNGLPIDDDEDDVVIGDYKKYPNEVGQIQTVHPREVASNMAALVCDFAKKDTIDLFDVAEFHARFEKIHPFYDGNGRVGRLLALKMCLANDIVPFFINDDSKMFYYMGLKEWQTDEKKERLLDVFLSMQDDMKCILDYFEIEYDKSEIRARDLIQKHTT